MSGQHARISFAPAVIVKGFTTGFLLYGVPACVINRSIKPNLRRAIAMGSFIGSFRGMYGYLCSQECNPAVERYKKAISAAGSTFIMISIDPSLTEWSVIASYLALRAIRVLCPEELNNPLTPIVTQCASAAQLISSWVLAPQDLAESHRNSLSKRFEISNENGLAALRSGSTRTCTALHPSISCKKNFVRLFVGDFHRGLRLYGMFAFIRIIVGVVKKNLNIPEVLQLWLRSTFYYATYITLAMTGICTANKITAGLVTRTKLFLHCWVAGLALFIESPGARVDQATYVGCFALDSYYKTFKRFNPALFKNKKLHQSISIMMWMSIMAILVQHSQQSKYIPRLLSLKD